MKGIGRQDIGLLILRIGLGLEFVFFGSQKGFGIFGGLGYGAQMSWFSGHGFHPILGNLAIAAELLGGLGVLVGLLTPIAALGIACTMAVAVYYSMSPPGQLGEVFKGNHAVATSGFFPWISFFAAAGLMFCGAGKISLDARLFGGKKASSGKSPRSAS